MAEAAIIDGQAIAARLRQRVGDAAAALRERHGIVPGLAAIIVGDDPASQIYVRNKARACAAAGLASFEHVLPVKATEAEIVSLVRTLGADDRVDGILVQLPLPGHINQSNIIATIDPAKDVDGFHPLNIGRLWGGQTSLIPCTPHGCVILVKAACPDPAGAEAVVLGRSQIVGRPLAALLIAADCTVTLVHTKSHDIPALCRRADILIAATGRPAMVKADWVKPGATVIDVGINRIATPQGPRIIGDVDFAAIRRVAGAITPVPGGVGPMTIACLLQNTVLAACRRRGMTDPPLLAEPLAASVC
jgi:methylenetetrahydrofolate dehydrogenase (NADP+) / methenyltetrahydrofolate cyclohydrolase